LEDGLRHRCHDEGEFVGLDREAKIGQNGKDNRVVQNEHATASPQRNDKAAEN
jgi:hypothetical protein